jgi:hypothetical protein
VGGRGRCPKEGSVICWISQLKAGERQAAQALWERYFRQLVVRARQKLRGLPRRAADEEDVALSAFDKFCRAAEQGRFPDLADREGFRSGRFLTIVSPWGCGSRRPTAEWCFVPEG